MEGGLKIKSKRLFASLIILMILIVPYAAIAKTINHNNLLTNQLDKIIVTVKTDKNYYNIYEKVEITILITNNGDEDVIVEFPDTQVADFKIINENDEVVYLWSYDKYFYQIPIKITIPCGETFKYFQDKWNQKDNDGKFVPCGQNYQVYGFLPGYPEYFDITSLTITKSRQVDSPVFNIFSNYIILLQLLINLLK